LEYSEQQIVKGNAEAPSPETLIDRARALEPKLRTRAQAAESARRLPDETIRELREVGLFRLMQPARYGGFELDFECLVRTVCELGRACGSTAWVYSVGAFHSWNVALFPVQAQDEVWGTNPDALAASSYVPAGKADPVEGGMRLSGRWPFASGCDHFEWIILGVRITDGADVRFCLVPRCDFRIDDDWHVAGLAGTGSKSVVLDNVFVPEHRSLSFDDARDARTPGATAHGGGLYKVPFFAISSSCLIAPALGIARGALEDYIAEIRDRDVRSIVGTTSKMADHHAIQIRVSEASGLIDAATLLILRDCRDTLATVEAGAELSTEQRVRNKRDQALAMRFAKNAVQLIIDATGAKGIYDDRPIQRAWRDLQAASAHITLNWDIVMPAHGRVSLGLDPGIII
jgi:alkylation response protein AidB-like acyl-CoA dehydrogenase